MGRCDVSEYNLDLLLLNPEQANQQIKAHLPAFCNRLWQAGKQVRLTLHELEDSKSNQQRRFYHGVILREIADQATINGERFDLPVWKAYMRERFIGHRWEVIKDPMTGKKLRRKVRISSESLGVKSYNKLIEEVTAFAATELNVVFSTPSWQEYRG